VRILVVEDDPKLARLLERGLREDGHTVDITHQATEAVWLGSEREYDAVVLDVVLPDGDGFDVCRRLRDAGRWAPILMLTARDGVVDRVRGLDTGADDYLTKPFAFAELTARLRALARRGPHERPAVLCVGSLELDPATRSVRRDDTLIDLTPKEYALLELFMRRPGEVVTRTQILDHAWDFAYDGTSNVVDVYVRYLRRKIDEPFGVATIHTVRGAGYRLVAD